MHDSLIINPRLTRPRLAPPEASLRPSTPSTRDLPVCPGVWGRRVFWAVCLPASSSSARSMLVGFRRRPPERPPLCSGAPQSRDREQRLSTSTATPRHHHEKQVTRESTKKKQNSPQPTFSPREQSDQGEPSR